MWDDRAGNQLAVLNFAQICLTSTRVLGRNAAKQHNVNYKSVSICSKAMQDTLDINSELFAVQ